MVLPPSPKRSRPTHSTAFRTRTGQVVFSPVDRPSVGEGPPPTAYNTSTLPTSHGLLPLSPQAMLSSGGAGTGFGTRRRPCNEPPNVLWMLRGDGASEYRAELEPKPRLASPVLPCRNSTFRRCRFTSGWEIGACPRRCESRRWTT